MIPVARFCDYALPHLLSKFDTPTGMPAYKIYPVKDSSENKQLLTYFLVIINPLSFIQIHFVECSARLLPHASPCPLRVQYEHRDLFTLV